MKIGIITYHNAVNYGAVLQAYALSKYLQNAGNEVEVIDYRCPAVEIQYRIKSYKDSSSIKNFLNHNLTCMLHQRKKMQFEKFRKKLPLSRTVAGKDLRNLQYDIIVTGSDQVFNPDCNRSDTTFLLDFAEDAYRYSYAASMGSIEQFKTYKCNSIHYLEQFNGISLREEDAAEYLSSELKRKCFTVVDPVWLLDKNDWEAISSKENFNWDNYIFVYNLMDFKYMRDYASNLARRTGLKLVVANRTLIGESIYFGRAKSVSNASPTEFLELLNNSSFFITDSFHGTSLAIICEKKFAVALNPSSQNTNSRFSSIINEMGLQGQIICEETKPYDNSIDFSDAKERIKDKIDFSKLFLDKITRKESV